jgi:hypothetical protein
LQQWRFVELFFVSTNVFFAAAAAASPPVSGCVCTVMIHAAPELKADASSVRAGTATAAIACAAMRRAPKGRTSSTPPQRPRLFNAAPKTAPLQRRPKDRASSTHSATSLSLETRPNLLNLPIARVWTLLHGLRLCPALFMR